MKYLCAVLAVMFLVAALAPQAAQADRTARKERPDSRALCYIVRPWPWIGTCSVQDSDGDGVADDIDMCPGTPAGVKVDARGCPLDGDGDGVWDAMDNCPDTPKGAKVDKSGCPVDSDGDGVWDGLDKCPGTPAGAKVDADGCPVDSDGDGVWDGLDKCPDTPAGTKVDADGCPVKVSKAAYEFLDTGLFSTTDITFEVNKADLKPECHKLLDEVGQTLSEWPEAVVEIGGHTDASGAEDYNMKLSEERANSVRQYLLQNFNKIKADNLKAKGYGEGSPVASNDTAEGRAQNRRVEFRILNKDELKRPVKDE
ncbi:MAG: OmpA family protein [Candidatus Krumholzibacteria bacterium]|nr:OmpA family protein [Candidatus Krumholzibacteria bacterium]